MHCVVWRCERAIGAGQSGGVEVARAAKSAAVFPTAFRCALIATLVACSSSGSYGQGAPAHATRSNHWPGGHYRPFSRESVFNQRLPRDIQTAEIDPNSEAEVAQILAYGGLAPLNIAADPGATDYTYPYYFASASDPAYQIRCTAAYGGTAHPHACSVASRPIHIPVGALPENSGGTREASDHHLAIVDEAAGMEYDFWGAEVPSGKGGPLTISWGGEGPLEGNGITGFGATHADISLRIGVVRPADLLAGEIPHALQFATYCAGTQAVRSGVFPFAAIISDFPCPNDTAGAPLYGTRLWLDLSDTEIAALHVPRYLRVMYTALAHYGAFLSDAIGCQCPSLFPAEGGLTYTAMGAPNPWAEVAARDAIPAVGLPAHRRYSFPMNPPAEAGLDLAAHLHVLAPCVTQKTC